MGLEDLDHAPPPCCDNPAEPTIGDNWTLRTYNTPAAQAAQPCGKAGKEWAGGCGDWTKTNPWRKPGSAPVIDPCGVAGGCSPLAGPKDFPYGGGEYPPFATRGQLGSQLPKLLHKTVWVAGSTAEVGWGQFANHGGGYSYRLCPAASELTEECMQRTPLDFVGDTQWFQFGADGMDTANRTEVPASQVSVGTVPAGSQWRRNPVPACATDPYGTGGGTGPQNPCATPLFPPAMPGVFGFGLGGTPKQDISSTVGIVDRVHVPKVPPGDYVLVFRWDCEQTSQVWQSCGDVTITDAGEPTKPFRRMDGCDWCCGDAVCSNCSKCLSNKTGDCAYCWDTVKHAANSGGVPDWETGRLGNFTDIMLKMKFSCLGHEDKDGGPGWSGLHIGNLTALAALRDLAMVKGVSPGCTKCWRDGGCAN